MSQSDITDLGTGREDPIASPAGTEAGGEKADLLDGELGGEGFSAPGEYEPEADPPAFREPDADLSAGLDEQDGHVPDVAEDDVEDVAEDDAEELEGGLVPETMSRMLFVDVVLVLPATHPVVVLQEAEPPYREIRIPVGGAEGVAISYAARQMATPRPLTHELMSEVLEAFGLGLDMVRITGVYGHIYHAEIVVSGPQGSRSIDCRPSDAIALSLHQRLPVPIMALPDVLELAGGGAPGQN
ncbi:MAG: bifunctional nuclease family protein [Acidimicrobiales bacterium]